MRAAGGFTGRANSTLTCGDPGLPVPAALRAVQGFAREHGIKPTAHVTTGSVHEQAIEAAGWRVDHDHPGGAASQVMTGPLEKFADGVAESRDLPGWWELAAGSEVSAVQRHVLGSGDDVCFASLTENDVVVAAVRGAVVEDVLHVARLAVRPAHRRRGLARRLMGELAGWGLAHGATTCVLQVAEHNEAAIRLYEDLGCTEHHRYRYWIPAGS
ncbi:Acetyltransferase (GNAT) family protein [Lentzea xinjiangensis]|uniref:Acetyltransferase (GNAT) family protein n=2 Tax=Lentzea xinjiangensis TaxID=402600 RepID=A0A1H9DMZ8_9PSEU|nr:GNAT family N-acetyltransferase [Lentzea xinjiangensis]SEQ14880.1 Acetyltransferase (GNAT) family protein [Lentzea xinjiangensis]